MQRHNIIRPFAAYPAVSHPSLQTFEGYQEATQILKVIVDADSISLIPFDRAKTSNLSDRF